MLLANSLLPYIVSNPIKLGLIWAVLGLAVFIAYRVLDIADLSVEGVLPLTAVLSIMMINSGIHPVGALFISILVGVVCGLITSSLSLYLKIPPLLAGIIIMTALFSFVLVASNGFIAINEGNETVFSKINEAFVGLMGKENAYWANFLGTTIILLIVIAIIGIGLYYFFGTTLGVAIRATGKNKAMARSQGINTNAMVLIGMGIAGGLVGLAGSLLGQMQTDASSTMGKGTIVIGLAIVFLGQIIFLKGQSFKVQLISVVLGGYIYWLIMTLIQLIPGFNSSYLYVVQSSMIILVMIIPGIIKYFASLRKKKQKQRGTENA